MYRHFYQKDGIISALAMSSAVHCEVERSMKNNREVVQSFAMVMQFGINMLVPILACTLFGAWLGEKLQISWLAIPFFVIGALAGMRNVFIFARRIYQPKAHSDKDGNIIEEKEKVSSDVKKTQ